MALSGCLGCGFGMGMGLTPLPLYSPNVYLFLGWFDIGLSFKGAQLRRINHKHARSMFFTWTDEWEVHLYYVAIPSHWFQHGSWKILRWREYVEREKERETLDHNHKLICEPIIGFLCLFSGMWLLSLYPIWAPMLIWCYILLIPFGYL